MSVQSSVRSPSRAEGSVGIEIVGLWKAFGDTVALRGLSLSARPGEILGVAGPNGAGKSTLVRILAGEVRADAGDITIDGMPWSPSIGDNRVAVVHQEPQLFPNLTVAENLMVGRERGRAARPRPRDRELLALTDLGIEPVKNARLGAVSLAVQQRTEIARALVVDARVFLFDEPNSALTTEESEELFRRMNALAADGRIVVLVSHRLAEVAAHSNRAAVLLDGQCTAVLEGAELTSEALARERVAGRWDADSATQPVGRNGAEQRSQGICLTSLQGWTHTRGLFEDVNLDICAGEMLAVVGVEGSGGRELVRSIAGYEPATASRGGTHTTAAGLTTSFVAAHRSQSLFPNFTIAQNLVSRLGKEITGAGAGLLVGRILAIAERLRQQFQIKTHSVRQRIQSLSGGNQQKVAIAAAVAKRPSLLVLEEPTRGVDIGSREEIHRLLAEYAAEGHAVVAFCTEIPEVFDAADRVLVISAGRVAGVLRAAEFGSLEDLASSVARLEARAGTNPARQPLGSGVESATQD